jgi:hypothetical protein
MGTNYYMKTEPCTHCGRGPSKLHIGKSSGGWCFALNTHPDEGINSLADWQERWKHGVIRDEYGALISPDAMRVEITVRAFPHMRVSNAETMERNHAVPGPHNLWRHAIDGRHCLAHGDGTYDIMRGEFS